MTLNSNKELHESSPVHGASPKIAFCVTRPGHGGVQKMGLVLAESLHKSNYNVVGIAPSNSQFLQRLAEARIDTVEIRAPHVLVEFGAKVLKGGLLKKLIFALCLGAYWVHVIYILIRVRPDKLYAGEEHAVLYYGLPARLLRIPVFWHVQRGIIERPKFIFRLCFWISTRVVCVSDAVNKLFCQRFIGHSPSALVTTIYNGVPSQKGVLHYSSSGTQHILLPARLTPEKGCHVAIEAMAKLPVQVRSKVVLQVAGQLSDNYWYHEYLRQLVATHNLDSHIKFLGFRDNIAELIAESTAVACPSVESCVIEFMNRTHKIDWREGFCLAAVEAMQAGVPVIASDSFGLGEIVKLSRAGLVCRPGCSTQLANCIEQVIESPRDAKNLGLSGRIAYEEHFRVEHMSRKFADLIDSNTP